MSQPTPKFSSEFNTRFILWLLIAGYTFILPDARLAYDAIVNAFGQDAAGRVPIVLVSILGLVYALGVYRAHKSLWNLLYLIPCGIIAYLIMHFEENPNKHIHIPEYVLMVWLLFAVLSRSYHSRDIFILIFLCTTALGVVDELEQGIHPARFYGLSDMIVNSASGLIGIFTVMGIKQTQNADWKWIKKLRRLIYPAGLVHLGLAGAVAMCAYLFRVQAENVFWGVYPTWLWIWNIGYLAAAAAFGILKIRETQSRKVAESDSNEDKEIAQLWVCPMMVIVAYMYLLLVYVSITGTQFR